MTSKPIALCCLHFSNSITLKKVHQITDLLGLTSIVFSGPLSLSCQSLSLQRERARIQDAKASGLMKAEGTLPEMELDLGAQLLVKPQPLLGLCTTFPRRPHPPRVPHGSECFVGGLCH